MQNRTWLTAYPETEIAKSPGRRPINLPKILYSFRVASARIHNLMGRSDW